MADASGTLSKAAWKKDRGLYGGGPAISYPQTPGGSDMGAGAQIPFTQEGIKKGTTRSKDPSLVGAQGQPGAPIIFKPVVGPLTGRARWSGFERFFAMALGFELPNGDDGSPKLIGTGAGTQVVTNATNATPIVITCTGHGYSNGDGIRIASVGGNTAANGDWSIAGVTANTFELVDSSGSGAYTSGGTCELYYAAAHIFEGDETIQDQAWTTADGRNAGFNANDRKVRRGQLGFLKQVSDWVHSSCLINKLTLAGNPQEVTLTVDFIAYDRVRGSYNSGSWTLPTTASEAQVLFQQLEVKIGARSGGEGGLATVRPNAFELTIDNKLKADDQTTESGTAIEIPVRDGFRETKLKLEFPRYNTDLHQLTYDLDTEMAGKLVFTGPTISGTGGETYLWGFFMSSLRFDDAQAPISGPGRLPETMEFYAERPGTTDIFAAGNYNSVALKHDSELVVKVQNREPQNYLTEY
jgi:hypothetical protein